MDEPGIAREIARLTTRLESCRTRKSSGAELASASQSGGARSERRGAGEIGMACKPRPKTQHLKSPIQNPESKIQNRHASAGSKSTCSLGCFGSGPEIQRITAVPRITAAQTRSMSVRPMLSQPRTTSPWPALIMFQNLPVIS